MERFGLVMYLALVMVFSIGILLIIVFTQREHFIDEVGAKDGDIVVNVSLMARSLSKELSKMAKEVSKNISMFK